MWIASGPRNAITPRHRPNNGPGVRVMTFQVEFRRLCARRGGCTILRAPSIRNGEKPVAALHGRRDHKSGYLAPTTATRDFAASRIGDATTGARTARTAVSVESGAMSRPSDGASDDGCAAR